jgi:hypothetical protein
MATLFDPATNRIILDSDATSAARLWTDWVDWAASGDNSKYLPAFRQVGGDDLGGGLLIPPYMFLLNGWRVRPREADHLLVITGNLFVEEGGSPVVRTLGNFNVSAQFTVPVQAQGISTGGVDAAVLARLLQLAEADEELTATHARLRDRTTGDLLLEKVVTGGEIVPVDIRDA